MLYKKLSVSEKQDFEEFARDFFEVHPHGKHQVVCCWQESGFFKTQKIREYF